MHPKKGGNVVAVPSVSTLAHLYSGFQQGPFQAQFFMIL